MSILLSQRPPVRRFYFLSMPDSYDTYFVLTDPCSGKRPCVWSTSHVNKRGSIANRLKSNGLFGALSSSEIDALSWCKSVQNSRFRSRRCWKHWLKPSAPHKSQPSLGYSAFS